MGGGPPSFPQDFTYPVVLGYSKHRNPLAAHTGLSPSLVRRSRTLLVPTALPRGPRVGHLCCPTTPTHHRTRPLTVCRFGLVPFRSPLLRESRLISLPPGTEMVQFPGCASAAYSFQHQMPPHDGRRVAPFGHPRISACLRLPRAFRSSPRPSSPQRAKASTVCSFFP